jgi:hypothetical protein
MVAVVVDQWLVVTVQPEVLVVVEEEMEELAVQGIRHLQCHLKEITEETGQIPARQKALVVVVARGQLEVLFLVLMLVPVVTELHLLFPAHPQLTLAAAEAQQKEQQALEDWVDRAVVVMEGNPQETFHLRAARLTRAGAVAAVFLPTVRLVVLELSFLNMFYHQVRFLHLQVLAHGLAPQA